MEINDQNLLYLLDAANYLEDENLKNKISFYIFKKLNLNNCLFYYKLTRLYNLKDLRKYFYNYFLQQCILKEDVTLFYNLKISELVEIFSCSELQISSELELFNAAVDWIYYKQKKRIKHMKKLLKLIRLPLLTDEILTDLFKQHPLCKSSTSCRAIINKAIKLKFCSTDKSSKSQFQNRYYCCSYDSNQIMIIGGTDKYDVYESKKYHKTACCFAIDENKNSKISTTSGMRQQRNDCKTAVIGNRVYCFGGEDSEIDTLESSEVYCRKSDTWSSIAGFKVDEYTVSTHCICSFMGKIYAFGNVHYKNLVYDPFQDSWTQISNCKIRRNEASCTVFQGQCVVLGGKSSKIISKKLKSVEKYDHYLNKWSFLANMQKERCEAAVVTKGNKMFVIGGICEYTCEVYDSISKIFSSIAKWKSYTIAKRLSSVVFDNNILIFNEDKICTYNIKTNEWSEKELKSTIKEERFNYSCVKLNKILSAQ